MSISGSEGESQGTPEDENCPLGNNDLFSTGMQCNSYDPSTDKDNTSMHGQAETPRLGGAPNPSPSYAFFETPTIPRRNARTKPVQCSNIPPPPLILPLSFEDEKNTFPMDAHLNPHGNLEHSGPELEDIRCTFHMITFNDGQFRKVVLPPSYIFQGLDNKQINSFCAEEGWIAVVFMNGGQMLISKVHDLSTKLKEFFKGIGCGQVWIIAPQVKVDPKPAPAATKPRRGGKDMVKPEATKEKRDKYEGLNTALVWVPLDWKDILLQVQTYAISRLFAFHILPVSKEIFPWVICLIYSNDLDTSVDTQMRMRFELKRTLCENATFINILSRRSKIKGIMEKKVRSFLDSLELSSNDCDFNDKGQQFSVWCLYAAPFGNGETFRGVEEAELAVQKFICSLIYTVGTISFRGEMVTRTLCRLPECHTFACPFKDTRGWKGPMKGITETLDEELKEKRKEKSFSSSSHSQV